MPMAYDRSAEELAQNSALLNEIEEAVKSGASGRAVQMADEALNRGFEHPMLLNLRAVRLDGEGKTEAAIADVRRALELKPWDYTIPNVLGLYLAKTGRYGEAMKAFDDAIRMKPDFVEAHYTKGWVAEQAGDLDTAKAAHEQALKHDPDHPKATASLAAIAMLRSQWPDARRLAGRALELAPGEPTATVALASAEIADGEYQPAAQRLKALLDANDPRMSPHGRGVALGRYADALAGQGLAAEAFAAYGAEKAQVRAMHAPRFASQATGPVLDAIADFLKKSPPWDAPAEDGPAGQASAQHVFLLGFPRSGTTLLEQVLATHPEVVTLEEREVLAEPAQAFLSSSAGMEKLAALGPEELSRLRGDYWRRVRQQGVEPEGKAFIDKLPLNTIKLPVIAKLFPRAKVLFAVRDPRDVVLSCFRQHFQVNAAMFEFLTLEGSAAFYDRVMRIGALASERLPINWRQHRYEALVEDFDGETRSLCDFIGIEWLPQMRDFAERARGRDIRTPSAPQVRRGLYAQGVGQWRAYAEGLAPVLPVLQPWVERFGYPAD